jgi:ribulose-5-phosphate 4-epimerase/fuculose-1-phosphate aldolase
LTTDPSEQPRLVASLGAKPILILRNHGLLVVGADIPGAFTTYWTLQRACEIQAATDAMGGENLPITKEVLDATPERNRMFRSENNPARWPLDGCCVAAESGTTISRSG